MSNQMGESVMQFYDNNPEWKAEADKLKAEVVYWHNQCHDVAVDGSPVPAALLDALRVAERNLAVHRRAESDRYFAALRTRAFAALRDD